MTAKTQTQRTTDHRSRRLRVELLLKPDSPEAAALAELVRRHGSQAAAVRYALMFTANAQAFGVVTVPVPQSPLVPPHVPQPPVKVAPLDFTRAAEPAPAGGPKGGRRENTELKPAPTSEVPPAPILGTGLRNAVQIGPLPTAPGSRLKGGKQ